MVSDTSPQDHGAVTTMEWLSQLGGHGGRRTRSFCPLSQIFIPSAECEHTWPAVWWAHTPYWDTRSQPGFPKKTTASLEVHVPSPESSCPSWLGPRAGMVEEPSPVLVQLSLLLTALKTSIFIKFSPSPPSFPFSSRLRESHWAPVGSCKQGRQPLRSFPHIS